MHRVAIAALRTVRAARASRAYPLLAGGAAAVCVAAELLPIRPPRASLAFCEQQPCDECEQAPNATDEPASYPYAPPKQDDPEANALVLASWRAKITEARELFAKLDYAGAERALQLALEEAGHFGASSGPVATSLLNLAQLYRRAGRLVDAEPLLERAADVLDQTAGPNNKVTLLALIDLATNRLERGDAPASLAGFRDVLTRLEHAEVNQAHARQPLAAVRAGCLFSMAKGHVAMREFAQAETVLRDVLRLLEERWGAKSPRLVGPCAELARVLVQQGKSEEGGAFLRRASELPDLKQTQRASLASLATELRL